MVLLVLGANSDMAHALSNKFAAAEKANLYLASRDRDLLSKKAADLRIRHQVEAEPLLFDAVNCATHLEFYNSLNPKPDGVILAFGLLGDQQKAQLDFSEAEAVMRTNFLGAVSILEIIAADFERRGHGFIIGISSVAGERGRQSNYIYGASKGAFTVFLSGLRNRLHKRNVRVMTVLAGFTRTKMTEHMELPAGLTAEPEETAEDIYRAFKKNKDVVYTKWFWKWIMLLIKALPEAVFKRASL
jgi:short-subunit dehydrogenase